MRCVPLLLIIPGICQSVTQLHMAEQVVVLLRLETFGDPRNIVLGGSHFSAKIVAVVSMQPSSIYFDYVFSFE